MIVITVGIVLLILVIIGGGILVFGKKDKEQTGDSQIPNQVSPEQVEEMFSSVTDNCTGALVWDIKLGETVDLGDVTDYTTSCKTDNYYSKMVGYTYDLSDNVILHVNVLKKVDNNAYKLDDTLIGEFAEDNLSDLLDAGTTYIYTYNKDGNSYKLAKVELMDTTVPEEVVNDENPEMQE